MIRARCRMLHVVSGLTDIDIMTLSQFAVAVQYVSPKWYGQKSVHT